MEAPAAVITQATFPSTHAAIDAAKATLGLSDFDLNAQDHLGPTGWVENGHCIPSMSTGFIPGDIELFAHLGHFDIETVNVRRKDYRFTGTGHFIACGGKNLRSDQARVVCDNGSCTRGYVSLALVEGFIEARRLWRPVVVHLFDDEERGGDGRLELKVTITPVVCNGGPSVDGLCKLFENVAHYMRGFYGEEKATEVFALGVTMMANASLLRHRSSVVGRAGMLEAQVLSFGTLKVMLDNFLADAWESDFMPRVEDLLRDTEFHARVAREALEQARECEVA